MYLSTLSWLETVALTATSAWAQSLHAILSNAPSNPLFTYPTSFTQGIIPKPLHSHNDYWRPTPLYTALSVGAISIEADVWLYNDTLHVGHGQAALTAERTLDSLYIQPILSVLRRQNPNSTFVPGTSRNGVYDTKPGQTLYLLVDLKTDGPSTWPKVIEALAPLREAGFLTMYDTKNGMVPGPVTVVGTGNTPRHLVQGVSPRDFFWDAPLMSLDGADFANVTADVSPICSSSFSAVLLGQFPRAHGAGNGIVLGDVQAGAVRELIEIAHAKKIMARFWELPGWPVGTRNAVWRALWDMGVDLLNVDDLEAAAGFWEGSG